MGPHGGSQQGPPEHASWCVPVPPMYSPGWAGWCVLQDRPDAVCFLCSPGARLLCACDPVCSPGRLASVCLCPSCVLQDVQAGVSL